jgi:iron complex transport system ATP-binding protein
MLETRNLSVTLDSAVVLKEISFKVKRGMILAIIGPNGAGKTTLLRSISGLIPVDKGDVYLDGEKLAKQSATERARLIATVPQAASLPPAFQVRDVVMLGRTPYLNWLGQTSPVDEEIVQEALQQTQTLPLINRKIDQLSAGEQQRVLLARALAQTTPVLLMDEPTSHLDLKYQVELLQLTRQLTTTKGLMTLLVLHDLNLASRWSDLIMVLDRGRLAAMGTPKEVLKEDLLSEVYKVPIRVDRQKDSLKIFPA